MAIEDAPVSAQGGVETAGGEEGVMITLSGL